MNNKTYAEQVQEMSCSGQIKELLLDKKVCRDIAKSIESIMLILNQNQRDMVTEANMERIGPAVLAHKQIINILDLFAGAGKGIIATEEKAEKLKNQ